MSSKSHSKKINNCKKIFELMGLLLQDNVTFKDIVDLLSQDKKCYNLSEDTTLFSVELKKYFNTMDLFGFHIEKEKGFYHLGRSPFKIGVNVQDIKAFELIKKFASSFDIDNNKNSETFKTSKEFNKFICDMEARFPDNVSILQKHKESKDELDFSFYFAELADKVIVCRKCCLEDYNVKISYYDNAGIKTTIAAANEILYRKGVVWLKIIEPQTNNCTTIPLDKIIEIKQQPIKSRLFGNGQTSVFKIRGRLSKNYTIRNWERSHGYDSDGWLTIVNMEEPSNELINRLLAYRENCKIESPKTLKKEFLNQIDSILALYQDT